MLNLTALLVSSVAFVQAPQRDVGWSGLDTTSFSLLRDEQGYHLTYASSQAVAVPIEWLEPPGEGEEDPATYVSSFDYDDAVTAFPISKKLIGIHVSSYAIQAEGSAQAAAGRDVFFVFDPATATLTNGGLKFGITKWRVRGMGCFSATAHRFLVGDVNADRRLDLGVIKETISCDDPDGSPAVGTGPMYEVHPIRWYVFANNMWEHDLTFDRRLPRQGYAELPLIGLRQSPVEFVLGLLEGRIREP